MLALGEMLAETGRGRAADPGYYRDTAYLHGALTAGATWAQLAEATGSDEAAARSRYRHAAEMAEEAAAAWSTWTGMRHRVEGGLITARGDGLAGWRGSLLACSYPLSISE
jgi:hypothetical protein